LYIHYLLKFVNPSFKPSNGICIANTRLRTNDCALSSPKFFLLRPYEDQRFDKGIRARGGKSIGY
jgi:hypothetical protein